MAVIIVDILKISVRGRAPLMYCTGLCLNVRHSAKANKMGKCPSL